MMALWPQASALIAMNRARFKASLASRQQARRPDGSATFGCWSLKRPVALILQASWLSRQDGFCLLSLTPRRNRWRALWSLLFAQTYRRRLDLFGVAVSLHDERLGLHIVPCPRTWPVIVWRLISQGQRRHGGRPLCLVLNTRTHGRASSPPLVAMA